MGSCVNSDRKFGVNNDGNRYYLLAYVFKNSPFAPNCSIESIKSLTVLGIFL